MNKQLNFKELAEFISPADMEAITAERHRLRADLCLQGWDWPSANAESWRTARRAQFGPDPFAEAMAVFGQEVA